MEFSEQELNDVANFYKRQRNRLLGELSHINLILKKMSGEDNENLDSLKMYYRPLVGGNKRGPKSVWGNFIINRLVDCGRPLTYTELIDDAMKMHKLKAAKKGSVRASILNSAFRLRTIHGRIESIAQAGKKEKHLIMTSWLDKNGKLTSPYLELYVKGAGSKPLAVNMQNYVVE